MAFLSATAATGSSGNDQVTIPTPLGVSDGDLLIYLLDSWNETVTWGFTPVATGVFSAVGSAGREGYCAWATKLASSEPSDRTLSVGGGGGLTLKAVAAAFTGRVSATPDASQTTNNAGASGTPISTPLGGVTAAAGDDIVVLTGAFSANITGVATFTAPTDYVTEQTASLTGPFDGGGVSVAVRSGVSAGATGTLTGSWVLTTGHADTAGVVLAFSASGGGAVVGSLVGGKLVGGTLVRGL